MSERDYDFDLPYHIPGMMLGMAINRLKEEDIWDDLPDDLRDKIAEASQGWNGVDITQEDLDSLDDETWERLQLLIG